MDTTYSLKLEMIHSSGCKLYPCTVKDRDTGISLFRVTPPGGGNKKEDALQVNETDMLDYVIKHQYLVRCSTLPTITSVKDKRTGLYGLKKRSIVDYTFSG